MPNSELYKLLYSDKYTEEKKVEEFNKLLNDESIDVNSTDCSSYSWEFEPCLAAVCYSHMIENDNIKKQIIKLFLKHPKIDVNYIGDNKSKGTCATPLMKTCGSEYFQNEISRKEVVETLLKRKELDVSISIRDSCALIELYENMTIKDESIREEIKDLLLKYYDKDKLSKRLIKYIKLNTRKYNSPNRGTNGSNGRPRRYASSDLFRILCEIKDMNKAEKEKLLMFNGGILSEFKYQSFDICRLAFANDKWSYLDMDDEFKEYFHDILPEYILKYLNNSDEVTDKE